MMRFWPDLDITITNVERRRTATLWHQRCGIMKFKGNGNNNNNSKASRKKIHLKLQNEWLGADHYSEIKSSQIVFSGLSLSHTQFAYHMN